MGGTSRKFPLWQIASKVTKLGQLLTWTWFIDAYSPSSLERVPGHRLLEWGQVSFISRVSLSSAQYRFGNEWWVLYWARTSIFISISGCFRDEALEIFWGRGRKDRGISGKVNQNIKAQVFTVAHKTSTTCPLLLSLRPSTVPRSFCSNPIGHLQFPVAQAHPHFTAFLPTFLQASIPNFVRILLQWHLVRWASLVSCQKQEAGGYGHTGTAITLNLLYGHYFFLYFFHNT